MEIAHSSALGAHMNHKRTLSKILSSFFWSGITLEVKRYCQSCDICQRTIPKGLVKKVPMMMSSLATSPFEFVYVDLIGEIHPASARGHRYILTMIDGATRYPCAAPLKHITTQAVADALTRFWSSTGFPKCVTSDNGSQFVSDLMSEILRTLSIKHVRSSPYHAQSNGLCENFNKSLKHMLVKLCHEQPKNWDTYIDACLFAYRETPHASTGFSPFELTHGRTVCGPMSILKQLWTKEEVQPEVKTTYQYVLDLRSKIEETCALARAELAKVQGQNKVYFDRRAKHRSLKVGDQVVLLLPMSTNKMELHWKGPFVVVRAVGLYDYQIKLDDGKVKTYHINMLKQYHPPAQVAAIASCLEEDRDEHELSVQDSHMMVHYNVRQKESYLDVDINSALSETQKKQVHQLLEEFQDIFTDVPKITNLGEHEIKLLNAEPVQRKPYPVPAHLVKKLDEEIDEMLKLNIISESTSYFCSPVVMVRKSDGSQRVCIDFRALNANCQLDPEQSYSADDIFNKLGGSKVYSKFDLSKGYWQVRLKEESKEYTSFSTHKGKFKFEVLPFGLSSAPMTFNRIMRKLLANSQGLHNYLDDVLAHNDSWTNHLATLRDFFTRMRNANLALKPSKCQIGYKNIEFLGQTIIEDALTPNVKHLNKIFEAARPETKTQVKAFLGLTGFYQAYVSHYSVITAPLTDLLRKAQPTKIKWGPTQEEAFQTLKSYLLKSPILKLPMLDKQFVLRVDACQVALGAVLMQYHDGIPFPVSYASKKLSERETKYPISQKEALGMIFGVQRFHKYLYAKKFVIETDHKPLTILGAGGSSCPKLMRWALLLQPYSFSIRVIPGVDNIGADFFSRHFLGETSLNPDLMTIPAVDHLEVGRV